MRTDSKQCQIRHEVHTRALSPHRRWLRQAQQIPRSIRLCIVAVVAFCAAVGFARGLRDIQDQNKKARPTIFPKSLDRSKIWSPDHPIRYNNGTHIDDKYAFFRHLGGGQEGSVDLYVDHMSGDIVVVKQMSSVARNQIPVEVSDDFLEVTTSWPTEIEAGLLLAGDVAEPYVPILDYFVLQSSTESCWAMVSPLLANRTLLNLAEKEKDQGGRTVHEIDSIYRPVVENLLEGLQSLHAKGLCHNDIKPNNIFIRDSTFWLLGDLGNVRHSQHAWHSTASWTRQNQWQDCRLNDVRRVLKTYLSFLRAASAGKGSFDDDFWHRRTSWSLMFWDFQRHPWSASRMANLSRTLYRPRELDDGNDRSSNDIHDSNGLVNATERELLCTSIPSDLWFVRKPV